jgi:hypothetical protein
MAVSIPKEKKRPLDFSFGKKTHIVFVSQVHEVCSMNGLDVEGSVYESGVSCVYGVCIII